MKYNKSMIILLLAIFILAVATASASDAGQTVIASEDDVAVELSQADAVEVVSANESELTGQSENGELMGQSENDEIISEENPGTFSELQADIDAAASGSTLVLDKDYQYEDGFDYKGILISKSITIDGNGHKIDAQGNSRMFNITSNDVMIKNMIFMNGELVIGNGAAIYTNGSLSILNCTFNNNNAGGDGGAVYMPTGSIENCSFNNNKATTGIFGGGAVFIHDDGNLTNCNFTNNQAFHAWAEGGAVYFYWGKGQFINCTFDNNYAPNAGAFKAPAMDVINCTFTNNNAYRDYYGGAILFSSDTNQGHVVNCYFENNSAYAGGAIHSSYSRKVTVDSCIFKTDSDTTSNTINLSPVLTVDNFTSYYNSGEKLTFDLKTNSGMPLNNANISISLYFENNDELVGNYSCTSDEGWIVNLPVGSYYAIFDTEYGYFQPINRTVKIIVPDVQYYVNMISVSSHNKTVNITAESNIPENLFWDGELLFILPDGTEINASYYDGSWWAVHEFDDYGVYEVKASYANLNNAIINNGTVNITRINSTITLDDIVLDYGDSVNVTVETEGAVGITAIINGTDVPVFDGYTIQISDLAIGNYRLTVTTVVDEDHNPATKGYC